MVVTTERWLEALTDPDPAVRYQALEHFDRAMSPEPRALSQCLAAIDRYGWADAYWHYSGLANLVPTDADVQRILDLWVSAPKEIAGPLIDWLWRVSPREMLARVLDGAPFSMLEPHFDRLQRALDESQEFDEERTYLTGLQERRRLTGLDEAALWSELQEWCRRRVHNEGEDRDFNRRAELLTRALSERGDGVPARVLELLPRSSSDLTDDPWIWEELSVIELAGLFRLAAAVEPLYQKSCDPTYLDDDYVRQAIETAWTRIGGDEVVAVCDRHLDRIDEDGWGSSAVSVLHNTRAPTTTEISIKWLHRLDDPELTAWLAHGLTLQGRPEANEAVHDFLLQHDEWVEHQEWQDVPRSLAASGRLTGQEFPEITDWQARIDEARRKRRLNWPLLPQPHLRAPHFASASDNETDDGWRAMAPIVNDNPKVGRNDPCPCGSGKKFKKCCLKNRAAVE